MRHPTYAASIAALTTLPLAYLTANGVSPGDAALLGVGLAGLAGLTWLSEGWRRSGLAATAPDVFADTAETRLGD